LAWDLSCPDWEARLRAGRSLVPDLPLLRAKADRAIAIFNRLRLPDVPDTPTLERAAADWSRDLVAALFGSWDAESKHRHVREIFELVPKKNAKTTTGAGIMLVAMMINRRPRAEYLLVGPTQVVSELAFNQAEGMIRADPELIRRFHVQPHIKKITYRGTIRSTLQIRTFSTDILTGVKLSGGCLIDELHLLGKRPDAASVMGQIRGGMVPYPEAFLVIITTQSDEPPTGVFLEELTKARLIRDGRRQANGTLPILYEFPPAMVESGAWRDPANWPLVTPNAGRSITIGRLIEDFDEAQEKGDKEIRRWASQHLNIQIGLALRSDRWSGADFWEAQADPIITLEFLLDRSEVVTIGIDGGGLEDLLGLAVLGRDKDTKNWLLWCHAWVFRKVLGEALSDDPKAVARAKKQRKSDIAPRLRQFAAEGDLTIVDELGEDLVGLADIIAQVYASGLLPEQHAIGLDPLGIGMIIDAIGGVGIDTSAEAGVLAAIAQGFRLYGAIATTGRKLGDGSLIHSGSNMMAWCVGNAKVEPKGNAVLITKQISGRGKIDPLMAAFNAVALMSLNPDARQSVYETRGFLVV
jgi:phage terminase large subunit-like protein